MTIATDLAAAIAAQNLLTQEVAGKMASINSTVNSSISSLNSWKNTVPRINAIRDSGRFFDYSTYPELGESISLTAPFSSSSMSIYDATVIEAGKFIHNNNNNGGTSGSMNAETMLLLTAIGNQAKRYGTEFYIAKVTAGGTISYGPILVNGFNMDYSLSFTIGSSGDLNTFSCWIKCISGAVMPRDITHKNATQIVNGSPIVVVPADGWVFCSGLVDWDYGYSMETIYSTANAEYLIALPSFVKGDFLTKITQWPVSYFKR